MNFTQRPQTLELDSSGGKIGKEMTLQDRKERKRKGRKRKERRDKRGKGESFEERVPYWPTLPPQLLNPGDATG